MTDMPMVNAALVETGQWIDDLMQRLGWHDKTKVFTALIGTLHALRDSFPRDEAVFIGAQMPALLRGFYYEGWHPSARVPARTRGAFTERIHEAMHRDPGVDAEQVALAVFALLAAHLPQSELEDAKAATPAALHGFWPS